MVTSVVKEGEPTPVFLRGQLVAYDLTNQYACRFNQQNLRNSSAVRAADFCDGKQGLQFHLNDTANPRTKDPPCAGNASYTLQPITWPKAFLQTNKFLGVVKVNQKSCNHFYARPVRVGQTDYQIDAFMDADNAGIPCQINVLDIAQSTTTTWAFDGFDTVIPQPQAAMCFAAKIQCPQRNWVCNVKKGADEDSVDNALTWVCGNQDCKPIRPGGKFFKPDTLIDHANWAFNAYFQNLKVFFYFYFFFNFYFFIFYFFLNLY